MKLSTPGDRGDTSLDPVDYRRSVDPMFDFFMEYSDNGILNPGSAHIGEDFTGTFISPEFLAYSVKRKQGKNEADATYRKYLDRRRQDKALSRYLDGKQTKKWHLQWEYF